MAYWKTEFNVSTEDVHDYGIDAPGLVRMFFIFGLGLTVDYILSRSPTVQKMDDEAPRLRGCNGDLNLNDTG